MKRPKLIVTGYKEHGKDTACLYLSTRYGLRASNSSYYCCELFIYNALKDKYGYTSIDECFNDRGNHRSEWYDMICHYNRNDSARLAKNILETNDIYNGVRSSLELSAIKRLGLVDYVLWVDSSKRGLPPEDKSSMTVGPEDADYILDNNGTEQELYDNINTFMKEHYAFDYYANAPFNVKYQP